MLHELQSLKQLSTCRIAIVRSLPALSDLLCTVPALRALRAAFPQAEITFIAPAAARYFAERFSHYIDQFLEFPGYPGMPEIPASVHKLPEFLTKAQGQHFDLALQMYDNGTISNSFTALLDARINAGFRLPEHYCPNPDYFLPYPHNEPEIWRHLRLMEFLGIPLQGDELEFPLQNEDFGVLRHIPDKYVCIHPGATLPEKRWSLKSFAIVADAIAASGYQVVLTGIASEANLTQSLAAMMRCKPIDLAGKTSLGAMAALLSKASLLVCNDTGVSHLADALKVKSVIIFTNASMYRWAPLNREIHRSLSPSFIQMTDVEELFVDPTTNFGDTKFGGFYFPVIPEVVITQVEDLLAIEASNVT
ncbi:ADP-heptose--LPS heptosyltransferase [Hapalosiphon sp. MRB220]|nr:ADP-heptose--LPS heptosyltransferase [Hapalosiphon sp. MRB220]